jgi:hypothetical protein
MSSVLRSLAQIAPRIGYFVALQSSDTEGGAIADAPVLGLSGETMLADVESFVNVDDMPSLFVQDSTINQGRLLKDLGREIIIVDDESRHVARYRTVLYLNNAAAEGIATVRAPTRLVRVWAANGQGVIVARTG